MVLFNNIQDRQKNFVANKNNEEMLVLLKNLEKEVSIRKVAEEKAEKLANIDSLTGLTNRRYFYNKMKTVLSSKYNRKNTYGILFLIDLDNFKRINDSLGHLVGDECLRKVSENLLSDINLLDGDVSLSRIAGDEFAFMLGTLNIPYNEVREKAIEISEKISKRFNKKITLDGREYIITVSIGISIFSVMKSKVKDIIQEADLALYEAKRLGKNQYYFFEDCLQKEVDCKLRIVNELQNGIDKDKFILFYQPITNKYGEIKAFETLIRWKNIKGDIVSASKFIHLIELSGYTVMFNQYVFEASCIQLKKWQKQGLGDQFDHLSINISSSAFIDKGFVSFVKETIAKYNIDTKYLMLEISESNMLKEFATIEKVMLELKQVGIRFSLDNFGIGYSSLAYIHKLPLSELKLYRVFIQNITTDARDQKFIKAIIALAKAMNFQVVAEGVEYNDQYDTLYRLGCDLFQGYLFSKPSLPFTKIA